MGPSNYKFKILKIRLLSVYLAVILSLLSFMVDGQSSNSYKDINVDSLLRTAAILPVGKNYIINHCQFVIQYSGEIRQMDISMVSRFQELLKAYPKIKFPFCNTIAVFKTRASSNVLMAFRDCELINKLQPYGHPQELRVKVKVLEGNFMKKTGETTFKSYKYRDFVIQDINRIK